ncbi:hypothetical protein QJS10_CPB15g00615 [Acorus calamus]|uniref:Uncharacterized protein n=1 Tax=Acorus calamus TaxID=4465 RepID=A0AAV9D3E9_ACOCL|nr:hypothetical protein QJS10_CPB15g00615 [Acorus calamus]
MDVLGLSTHPNQTQSPFPSPTLQTVPMPPNHDRRSAILHRRITGGGRSDQKDVGIVRNVVRRSVPTLLEVRIVPHISG